MKFQSAPNRREVSKIAHLRKWQFILLVLVYAYCGRDGARAQQTQPVSTSQANCILLYPATGTSGTSQVLDNRAVGCVNFQVTLSVPTTISAVSWTVQWAQDNGSASCATCTWTTYTAATGANPITSTAGGNATFTTPAGTAYYDFLRMVYTATGTGLLSGKLTGTLSATGGGGGGGGGGCPGTTGTPCVVVGNNTNNNAAPGATNVGALVALANAAAPTDTEGDQVLLSTDLAGNLRTSGTFSATASTTALSGQQAVTGTAVALANHALTNGVCVKALIGNTINVYLGGSAVTTATGLELAPGEVFCYTYSNTDDIYVIASTTGASVSWGAGH
jgi:hypothetical protein